jgi:hypothetical protein
MRHSFLTKPACILLVVTAVAMTSAAQAEKPNTTPDAKAEQIIQRGLQSVGGSAYLNIKTLIGRGYFTDFKDGVSGIPSKFVDYILYPDKERTEFIGGGARIIQTNDRDQGWLFDGAAKTLKDQNAEQVADFRLAMRTSFENLLHGWWRQQGATLSYVGRREAGLAKRNETVRITYPDGFWIEYEFAASDGLPAKVLYERKHKRTESGEIESVSEEDRLFKPINMDGVTVPYIVDHFRNGVQTSRINYDTVEINKPVADALFAKPANIKAIK